MTDLRLLSPGVQPIKTRDSFVFLQSLLYHPEHLFRQTSIKLKSTNVITWLYGIALLVPGVY